MIRKRRDLVAFMENARAGGSDAIEHDPEKWKRFSEKIMLKNECLERAPPLNQSPFVPAKRDRAENAAKELGPRFRAGLSGKIKHIEIQLVGEC